MEMYGNFVKEVSSISDNDLVCVECGCDKIQEKYWVEVNSREIMDTCDDEVYCPDCEGDTYSSTRKQWKEDNKEEEEEK